MEEPASEPANAAVRRVWTPQEDRILQHEAELQLQNGSLRDWKLIATKLPHRTNKDCRKRWSKICDTVNKGPWSSREDKLLEEAIAQVGPQWISVAKRVGTRHADQCAKRWRHFLDPSLNHGQWESEDDARLWTAVLKHGSNWRRVVEEEFPERSPSNVKNRYAVIKNVRRRGKISVTGPANTSITNATESTSPLFSDEVNNGRQGSTPTNFNALISGLDTPLDSESAGYSADALDDDSEHFFGDLTIPQTLSSPANGTVGSTNVPAMQQHSGVDYQAAEKHAPNSGLSQDVMSAEFNYFGNETSNDLVWDTQNDPLVNRWADSALQASNEATTVLPTASLSRNVASSMGEAKKVSLILEDMRPETANRVTTMLLNSNVDVKMKMTVQ